MDDPEGWEPAPRNIRAAQEAPAPEGLTDGYGSMFDPPKVEAPAPEGLTIYAVVFSNYEPAEINSLWRRREDADARCAELMEGKDAWGWEVRPWTVK